MVALIGAGCSSGSAENGSTGTGSSTGNGNSKNATNRDKAVKFAECMRDNGVSEFPDPNAGGDFVYGIKRGSSLDPSTAAWKKAISACKDLQPAASARWRSTSAPLRPSRRARRSWPRASATWNSVAWALLWWSVEVRGGIRAEPGCAVSAVLGTCLHEPDSL
jgi:hypothetical protein